METIKGNWCVYCSDANDTEFKKVLEILNKGVSPSKKWLGREKFYYGIYKGKRIRGVTDNKIIKKIPHVTIEQVLCAKDDFPKEFCIKITDENRSEIKRIANEAKINELQNYHFISANDTFYFYKNGQFFNNSWDSMNVPIITFEKFKAHFDKQNVINPENDKCSIRLPGNIKSLLQIARSKYPIGTKYKYDNNIYISEKYPYIYLENDKKLLATGIAVRGGGGLVYEFSTKKWAEIIKTPKENKELDAITETLEVVTSEIKKLQEKVSKLETKEKSNEKSEVNKFIVCTIKNKKFLGFTISDKTYFYNNFIEFQKTLNDNSNNSEH